MHVPYCIEADNYALLGDFRFELTFRMFDTNNDGVLDYHEIRELVREMSRGDGHVDFLLDKMKVAANTTLELSRFMDLECRQIFHDLALRCRDPLKQETLSSMQPSLNPQRVLLAKTTIAAHGDLKAAPPRGQSICMTNFPEAVDVHSEVDPIMLSKTDWRGLLVDRTAPVFAYACTIVENCRQLSLQTTFEDDTSDKTWLAGENVLEKITGITDRSQCGRMLQELTDECMRICRNQSVLLKVSKPVKVFGDVHGQLRDLLVLFREFGYPSNHGGDIDGISYIFNGDWVDRGQHQVETVTLMFALKVAFPSRIHLIRGNHEFRAINEQMGRVGFMQACQTAFGPSDGALVYETFHLCFEWLPIAALVSKAVLVIHGGIGDGRFTLQDLNNIVRPISEISLDDESDSLIRDCLWSDPIGGDETMRR
jgi:Calcineurin-like phosphoesterase/EF-hand domain